jgi:hypothetical protein
VRLRSIHLAVGLVGVLVFAGTGQYMRVVHAGLYGMADGPRLFFRSAHIYLLWASLLNLALGCYLERLRRGALSRLQLVGSVAILAGPPLLCLSFFSAQYNPSLSRPMGQVAIFLSFAGALLHAATVFWSRVSKPGPNPSIEGTSNIRLRLLSAAPHVKR